MTKKFLYRVGHTGAALSAIACVMSACATESEFALHDGSSSQSEAWQGQSSALSSTISEDGKRVTLDGLQYAHCGESPLLTSQSLTLRIPIPVQGHRASGLQSQIAPASLDLQPNMGWDYARNAIVTVTDGSEAGEIRVMFDLIPPRHVPRKVTLELPTTTQTNWKSLLRDNDVASIAVDMRCNYDPAAVVVREIHSQDMAQDMAMVSSIAIESFMECARASGMSEHPQLRLRKRGAASAQATDASGSTAPHVWIRYVLESASDSDSDSRAAPQRNGLFLSSSGDILLYPKPVSRFEITPVQPGQDLSSLISIEQEDVDPYCMGYNLKPQ